MSSLIHITHTYVHTVCVCVHGLYIYIYILWVYYCGSVLARWAGDGEGMGIKKSHNDSGCIIFVCVFSCFTVLNVLDCVTPGLKPKEMKTSRVMLQLHPPPGGDITPLCAPLSRGPELLLLHRMLMSPSVGIT